MAKPINLYTGSNFGIWLLLFCMEKVSWLRMKLHAAWVALNLGIVYASKHQSEYAMFTSVWTASILMHCPFKLFLRS